MSYEKLDNEILRIMVWRCLTIVWRWILIPLKFVAKKRSRPKRIERIWLKGGSLDFGVDTWMYSCEHLRGVTDKFEKYERLAWKIFFVTSHLSSLEFLLSGKCRGSDGSWIIAMHSVEKVRFQIPYAPFWRVTSVFFLSNTCSNEPSTFPHCENGTSRAHVPNNTNLPSPHSITRIRLVYYTEGLPRKMEGSARGPVISLIKVQIPSFRS